MKKVKKYRAHTAIRPISLLRPESLERVGRQELGTISRQRYHLEPLATKRQAIRKFFGKMTSKEYQKFLAATRHFREIDQEMWK